MRVSSGHRRIWIIVRVITLFFLWHLESLGKRRVIHSKLLVLRERDMYSTSHEKELEDEARQSN